MKIFLFTCIFQIIFTSFLKSQESDPSIRESKYIRNVIIYIERTSEQSRTDKSDPLEDIKKMAIREKFDWSKIKFYTPGFQSTKIFFILEENSKNKWETTENFVKILLKYQRQNKFVISDIRNLKENPNFEPPPKIRPNK